MIKNLLLTLLVLGSTLHAEATDKWKINAGTLFVTNFESELGLTPKNVPLTLRLNTKKQLGMKNDTAAFTLNGYYRFNDTHSVGLSYFAINSKGSKTIGKAIDWGEDEISAGAKINSSLDISVYKIAYAYSFYHNEDVELALTVGLHITSFDIGLGASGLVNSIPDDNYNSNVSISVPLPVLGFKGEYTIIPKQLFANYKTDYFALSLDSFKGNLVTSSLNLEYRFVDHVGIGLGYYASALYLEAQTQKTTIEISNNISGALVYFTYVY